MTFHSRLDDAAFQHDLSKCLAALAAAKQFDPNETPLERQAKWSRFNSLAHTFFLRWGDLLLKNAVSNLPREGYDEDEA